MASPTSRSYATWPTGTSTRRSTGTDGENVFFGAAVSDGIERTTSVALQADGKIVVGGYTNTTGTGIASDFAVARLNPNGSLDTTFNGTGKWTYNLGSDEHVNAVAIQPDGKIVLAGSWDGGSADIVVMRLNPNGTFDTTFNDIAVPLSYNGDGKLDIFFGETSWRLRNSRPPSHSPPPERSSSEATPTSAPPAGSTSMTSPSRS